MNGESRSSEKRRGSLKELVEEARFHVEFEQARVQGQFQRAGWLVALDGVLLALAAGQAHELLDHASRLGSVGKWIAAGALMVAGVGVFISALLAGVAILKSRSWELDEAGIKKLTTDERIDMPLVKTEERFLRVLVNRVIETRAGFTEMHRWLGLALRTLGVALAAVVLYVGVFSWRSVDQPSCSGGTATTARVSTVRWQHPGAQLVAAHSPSTADDDDLEGGRCKGI